MWACPKRLCAKTTLFYRSHPPSAAARLPRALGDSIRARPRSTAVHESICDEQAVDALNSS
eukprot:6860148-Prymnesium_polylepis.1